MDLGDALVDRTAGNHQTENNLESAGPRAAFTIAAVHAAEVYDAVLNSKWGEAQQSLTQRIQDVAELALKHASLYRPSDLVELHGIVGPVASSSNGEAAAMNEEFTSPLHESVSAMSDVELVELFGRGYKDMTRSDLDLVVQEQELIYHSDTLAGDKPQPDQPSESLKLNLKAGLPDSGVISKNVVPFVTDRFRKFVPPYVEPLGVYARGVYATMAFIALAPQYPARQKSTQDSSSE